MIAVETKGLKKEVNGIRVLKDINLSLKSNEAHAIVGSNFSGRIEFLKIIASLIKEYEGEVKIFGNPLNKKSYIDSIGMSFGIKGFVEEYTAFKNLKVLSNIRGRIGEDSIKSALSTVGLLAISKEKVEDYDYEERKRLSIAQAIMERPRLIIIDEPFNYFKDESIDDMKSILNELTINQRSTLLLGSRDDFHLKDICSSIHNIRSGVIGN